MTRFRTWFLLALVGGLIAQFILMPRHGFTPPIAHPVYAWTATYRDIGPFPVGTVIKQSGRVLATVTPTGIDYADLPAHQSLSVEVFAYNEGPWLFGGRNGQPERIRAGRITVTAAGEISYRRRAPIGTEHHGAEALSWIALDYEAVQREAGERFREARRQFHLNALEQVEKEDK